MNFRSTDTRRPIALIGLSGTGKSTIGRLLAEQLGMPLFDTDQWIVQQAEREIAAIFAEQGEAAFRDLETAALQAALEQGAGVIATGGGIVLRSVNRELLVHTRVIWLDAPIKVLVARLEAHAEARPLLQGSTAARLERLRSERAPIYADVAEYRVSTAERQPALICAEILNLLQENPAHGS